MNGEAHGGKGGDHGHGDQNQEEQHEAEKRLHGWRVRSWLRLRAVEAGVAGSPDSASAPCGSFAISIFERMSFAGASFCGLAKVSASRPWMATFMKSIQMGRAAWPPVSLGPRV